MNLKTLFLTLFAFALLSHTTKAQYDEPTPTWIVGYQYQKLHTLEVGLSIGSGADEIAWAYHDVHFCGELLFGKNQKPLLGTTVGVAFSLVIVNVTPQLVAYTDFNSTVFAFRPEFGLSYYGIDLTYGRNYFNKKDNFDISKHCITLRITYWKGESSLFQFRRKSNQNDIEGKD